MQGSLSPHPFPCAGLFFAAMLLFYLVYSLPMSYIKHSRVNEANDGLKWVPQGLGAGVACWACRQLSSLPVPLPS